MIDAAKIIQALQCDRAYCACHRDGTGEHSLHCPAHQDQHPSLSLSTKNDQLLVHCHAGCTQDAVIKALRARSLWRDTSSKGVQPNAPASRASMPVSSRGLTLLELAQAKKLPVDFLFDLGVDDEPVHGRNAVSFPYLNQNGEMVAVRYRLGLAKEAQRFAWRRQDRPILYGLNKLAEIRKAGWVLLVEGESDVWTLRYYGLPALGIPGKGTWRNEWAAQFAGVQVFVWQEPDAADLVNRLAASIPDLRVIVAPSGIKDPSEAHLLGHDLTKLISELKATASPLAPLNKGGTKAGIDDSPGNIAKPAESPGSTTISLFTLDEMRATKLPELVWAVPKLLPTGLSILAGAPKIGKSWLALQIALAVASGGMTFNEKVTQGAILYLALEDSLRRLIDRVNQQKWPEHLPASFMCTGNFESQIGDLRNGGAEKLSNCIEQGGYRFVVIDTLSRAIHGDQNDVYEMTRGLEPLHQIAHDNNVALLLIDHHRKSMVENADAIADILGSTAKGAMADTVLGLYRERGKRTAKLSITGRDIEERTLALTMDWLTGCWQLDGNAKEGDLTERQKEILTALADLGEAQVGAVVNRVGQPEGNTYRRLQDLVSRGLVVKIQKGSSVFYRTSASMGT